MIRAHGGVFDNSYGGKITSIVRDTGRNPSRLTPVCRDQTGTGLNGACCFSLVLVNGRKW